MRLTKYLNEKIIKTYDLSYDEMKELLYKDCGKYIQLIKDSPKMYKRSAAKNPKSIDKRNVRRNRRPVDTPLVLHNMLDNFLYNKFGWYPRSDGLFVWTTPKMRKTTGEYWTFPIGKFSVVWNTNIKDIFYTLGDWLMDNYDITWNWFVRKPKESKEQILNEFFEEQKNKLFQEYTDNILQSLRIPHSVEVMVNCEYYYLINQNYDDYMRLLDEELM